MDFRLFSCRHHRRFAGGARETRRKRANKLRKPPIPGYPARSENSVRPEAKTRRSRVGDATHRLVNPQYIEKVGFARILQRRLEIFLKFASGRLDIQRRRRENGGHAGLKFLSVRFNHANLAID